MLLATLASLAWPSPQCRQRAEASEKQLAQSHAPPSDRLGADSRDARLWGARGPVMRVQVRVDGNAHERTQTARRASTAQTGSSGAAQVGVGSPPAAAPSVLDDTDGRSQDRSDTSFSPPLASWSRWESPVSSPGKEEGRCAVALNSDGYRAPYISKGLLLPRKRGSTVTPSRNRFGLYRITEFHLRPPFELRTAVLAQKRRKRPVWVALAGLRSDAVG